MTTTTSIVRKITMEEAKKILSHNRTGVIGEKWIASTLLNQTLKVGMLFFYCEQVESTDGVDTISVRCAEVTE